MSEYAWHQQQTKVTSKWSKPHPYSETPPCSFVAFKSFRLSHNIVTKSQYFFFFLHVNSTHLILLRFTYFFCAACSLYCVSHFHFSAGASERLGRKTAKLMISLCPFSDRLKKKESNFRNTLWILAVSSCSHRGETRCSPETPHRWGCGFTAGKKKLSPNVEK